MDGAAKLARQYFLELSPPQPHRVRFIAREGSYHGNTLGALSISGHKARRSIYEPMLGSNVSHVSACNDYRGREQDETVPGYVDRLARELDREFQRVRPGKVCAFVAEPVVGAVSDPLHAVLPSHADQIPSVGTWMRPVGAGLLESHEDGMRQAWCTTHPGRGYVWHGTDRDRSCLATGRRDTRYPNNWEGSGGWLRAYSRISSRALCD